MKRSSALLLYFLLSSSFLASGNSTRGEYGHSISADKAATFWITDGTSLDNVQDDIEKVSQEESRCLERLEKPRSTPGGLYCKGTWDNVTCWPDTMAGEVSSQPCPTYISNFNKNGNATRKCMEDGTWYIHPEKKFPWTNFSLCVKDSQAVVINSHVILFKVISQVGYGMSIIALTGAIVITLYFRKLRCARNLLHINLYASFIARAVMTFLKNWLFISGLGFSKDISTAADGSLVYRDDISHWECKSFMVVFNYTVMTNSMWIFVEGLYIHTIVFFDVFFENTSIKGYVVLGWGISFLFLIPWVLVKLALDNTFCWNIHLIQGTFWIIKGPLVVSVLVNFVFFLNIVRVLFTKLKANNSSECRTNRHKTFARSTLVLIPLFGVPYIIFLGLPENLSAMAELVKIYFEITFNSFNGFLVSILFCYLNGEVQNELKKAWNKHSLKRNANYRGSQTENIFLEQFAVVQPRDADTKREVHKIFAQRKE